MTSYTLDTFLSVLVYQDHKITYDSRTFSELSRSEIEDRGPLLPEDIVPLSKIIQYLERDFSLDAIDFLYSLFPESLLLEEQSIGATYSQGKSNFEEAGLAGVTLGDIIKYTDSVFLHSDTIQEGRKLVDGLINYIFCFVNAALKKEHCEENSIFPIPRYNKEENIINYLNRLPEVYDLGLLLEEHKLIVAMFRYLDSEQGKEDYPIFHGFKEEGTNETGFTLGSGDGASITFDPGALFFYPYDNNGEPLAAIQYLLEMRKLYQFGPSCNPEHPDAMHEKYQDNHGGPILEFTHEKTMVSVLAYYALSFLAKDAASK